MTPPAKTDWNGISNLLYYPGMSVCLRDAAGAVYLLRTGLDKHHRISVGVFVNGKINPDWFRCVPRLEDASPETRALFRMRKRYAWPKQRRLPKRQRDRLKQHTGIDVDAHHYQAVLWHDPDACLAHLRKRLPGLRRISAADHDAAVQACQEAA
jgi:hypothetical protein